MASLLDLPGAGRLMLAAFAAQLAAQGVALPDRQYLAPGSLIVWDGEQLTVCLMSIDQGDPGMTIASTFIPPTAAHYQAAFSVNLVRKVAVINTEGFAGVEIPTAAQLDVDGGALVADAAALILAGQAIHEAGTLTDGGQGCVIGPLAPLGPAGGLAGSRLLITLSLS